MIINKITYDDKSDLSTSSVAAVNKIVAADMNQIKSVANSMADLLLTIYDNLGIETTTWSSGNTYKKGDIVIYNMKLYENLTGTNISTTPDQDSVNWAATTILVDN